MGGHGDHMAHKSCGFWEVFIFLFALVGGTLCSLTSKVMLTMKGRGMTGEIENFSYPLFQTFGMFLGMTAALVMHFLVKKFRLPFPGYTHLNEDDPPAKPIPTWMYFTLIIPSIFDLVATCLAMFGLRHVNVSIYQMLRGSAIIFVALLKQFALGHKLQRYKWVGIAYNVISIILVGLTALLTGSEEGGEGGSSPQTIEGFQPNPLYGVVLILCGAFVQSLQYVFEEKVMSASTDDDVPATPPLLLIGMEGLWGSLICIFILYPIAYHIKGDDHGCFENPFNTIAMISNTPQIQAVFTLYFFSILLYNILALLVTFMLDSVWHAILDNFRPVTVWGLDLFIFYCVTTTFGESWSSEWSWLQLLGMLVLLYGTAIYNAPNPGSIRLDGGVWNCFIDCSHEYPVAADDSEKARILDASSHQSPKHDADNTPFYSGMSPYVLMSPAAANREKERRAQAMAERVELRNLASKTSSASKAARKDYGGVNNA